MPRARNLKHSFFKDAKVVRCSFESRLLFQGLWCLADYKGRLKYESLEIKMEVFPADNVDIEQCMSELEKNGLIEIYTDHSGTALVQVINFSRHQNPHVNEKQDKNKNPLPCLPSPEECKKSSEENAKEKVNIKQRVKDALVVLREYSESDPADSLSLIPDSLFLYSVNTESCDSVGEGVDQDDAFEKFWVSYPKKKSKGRAEKAWQKIKPSEHLITQIMSGVERAKTSIDWLKDDGQFIPHPASWLNAEGWKDEIKPAGSQSLSTGRNNIFDLSRQNYTEGSL